MDIVKNWLLLSLLADGCKYSVEYLAEKLAVDSNQLSQYWSTLPNHVRERLICDANTWQLRESMAFLSAEVLQQIADKYGMSATLLPICDSSNTQLMSQAKCSGAQSIHQHILVTYEQTHGRGRQGKRWESRCGECLMMSLGWRFAVPQCELGSLALVVALAISRALNDIGVAVQVKWPNDLVVGERKLGGILIETLPDQNGTVAVIGLGLNILKIHTIPQSIAINDLISDVQVSMLYQQILHHLSIMLPEFEQQGFEAFQVAYNAIHRDHGHQVSLSIDNQEIYQGIIRGVSSNGALQVEQDSAIREFTYGEVSLRTSPQHTISVAQSSHMKLHHGRHYLLLDGGNSKLKWAWVQNGIFVQTGRAAYSDLRELSTQWKKYGSPVIRIIGSAVCGRTKQALVEKQLEQPIQWLSSMSSAMGIYNHYQKISEHGADRWFNVLGARRFTDKACVVVSCGTAVTVDALTTDNHYLGGSILPGFHLMRESLAKHTAHLNCRLGKVYPFATSTSNALASGILDSVCGAVVLMHQRLSMRLNHDPVDVILTGGGATRLAQGLPKQFLLDNHIEIVDNLVIHGLLNWIEHE